MKELIRTALMMAYLALFCAVSLFVLMLCRVEHPVVSASLGLVMIIFGGLSGFMVVIAALRFGLNKSLVHPTVVLCITVLLIIVAPKCNPDKRYARNANKTLNLIVQPAPLRVTA